MAINKITGFNIFSNEPIDSRQIAYANTAAAIAAIPEVFRYIGLTVPIFENGSLGDEIIEYWWEKGLTDGDLVVKIPVFGDLPVSTFNNDVGYFNNASFNSANGNFTLNVGNDDPTLPNVVVNLDGRYILLSEKAVANGVATLDASGLIPSSQIPPLAITEYLGNFTDTTAALANAGVQASQRGDWFTVDSNGGESWIVTSDSPTVIGDITKMSTPTDAVLSVNGETGVVSLDAGDIGFTPYLTITSTDVQAAIQELKDELDNVSSVTVGGTNQIPRSNTTNSDFLYESFFNYDRTNRGVTSYGANLAGDFRKEAGSGGDIVQFGTEVEAMGAIYGSQGGVGDNFGLNTRSGYNLTFRTVNTIRLEIDSGSGDSDFQGNTIIAGRAEIDNVAVDGNGYIVSRTANDRYFLTTNLFGNSGYRIGYLYDDANTSAGYIEFDRITDTDEYVRLLFLFTRPNLSTWQPIAISSNDESILFNGIDINVTGDSPINVNYGPLEATLPNWDNTFQLVTSIGGRNRSTSVGSWEWFWPDGEPAGLGWDKGFRMGTLSTNDSSSSVSNANNLFQISFDTTIGVGNIPSGVNYLRFSEGNALESYIASDYLQLYSVKDDIQPTFNNGIPLADGDGIINSALVGNQGNGSYIAYNSSTSSWEVLGKDFKTVFTSPFVVNVTSTTPTNIVNQTINLPRAGNYLVHISYIFSGDTATSDVVTSGSFGGVTFGSINSEIMRVEPKDNAGDEGDGRGTDQKYPFGRYYYATNLSVGNNTLNLSLSSPSGAVVSIWDVVIVIEEVR